MAEFVEQKIQEMIPEIEELERLELLTADEIKKLIQKRRDFEYQVCKRKKEKHTFMNYVLFDIKLLELIGLRREKQMSFKKLNKIDHCMSQRVMKRLRLMTRLWRADFDIWKLRISFSKARKFFDEVSVAFTEQIRIHGNEESLWIGWAQWEMEGRDNFDKARNILLSRAPLYHPDSVLIRKEYFRLELLYIKYLKSKKKKSNIEGLEEIITEQREKVLDCGVPELVYKSTLEEFEGPRVLLDFFGVASEFTFATRLRDRIYRDLISKFPTEADVWLLKGRLMFEGIEIDEEEKEGTEEEEKEGEKKKTLSSSEKLTSLFFLYDEALSSSPSGGVPTLVNALLQDLFCLLREVWGVQEYFLRVSNKVLEVFELGKEHLSVAQYLIWSLLSIHLKRPHCELKTLLEWGTACHPDSPHLLLEACRVLQLPTAQGKNKTKMLEGLSGKVGADFCSSLLSYEEGDVAPKKKGHKDQLCHMACNHQDPTVATRIRCQILKQCKDMSASRRHYKKYCVLPPFSIRLHALMIEKELVAKDVCVARARTVFDIAVQQFGACEPGLWLCYHSFERVHGDPKRALLVTNDMETRMGPGGGNPARYVQLKFSLETCIRKKNPQIDTTEEDLEKTDLTPFEFWSSSSSSPSCLPDLFEEEPPLMYSSEEERKGFFRKMALIGKEVLEKACLQKAEEYTKLYEGILSIIHGVDISLGLGEDGGAASGRGSGGKGKGKGKGTGRVEGLVEKSGEYEGKKGDMATEIAQQAARQFEATMKKRQDKLLESSEILSPEFDGQKQIIPYYLSQRMTKKNKKDERAKTKGEGWFHMSAPEMTPEVRRDLQVLKMRSILDPKTHYKRNDLKDLPKYFQMGKVIDSPLDFFSSRVPKKERKANFALAIMNNEDAVRYQKRKYSEIVERKETKKRKTKKAKRDGKNKKSKKNET